MKFISKNINLRIILEHGVAADPISGRAGKPSVHVKFNDGTADVSDAKLIKLMKTHSGFGSDFIEAPETGLDPYSDTRKESEPVHQLTEMKYGQAVKTTVSPHKIKLTPEMNKVVGALAQELALKMAPELAVKILEQVAGAKKEPVEEKEEVDLKDTNPTPKTKTQPKNAKDSKK